MPIRETAVKLRIKDIHAGELRRGASDRDNILITPFSEEAGRVRVLATVVRKYVRDDGKYAVLTLDDATDTITLRAFKEQAAMLAGIDEGDIVDAIGGVREYEGEIYINAEAAPKITDPNWELVRKLELAQKIGEPRTEAEVRAETPKESIEETAGEADAKSAVREIITKFDEGDGAKYTHIARETGLDDEKLDAILGELMEAGEVYEPKIGKFKRV